MRSCAKRTVRIENPIAAGRRMRWARLGLVGLAIFAGALCTRLCFLLASPDKSWPHSVCFEGDGPLWIRFAAALQRGEPFEFDLPIHTPGMAYLMAWIWNGKTQDGFIAQKLLLCVLSSLSCVLIWLMVRKSFGDRVAVMAGLFSAASFALTVQSTSLNNETPYTFLVLVICVLTLRTAARRSIPGVVLLALLNGAAVLFRAEHTLLFVALCAYLVWRWGHSNGTAPAPEEHADNADANANHGYPQRTPRLSASYDLSPARRRPGVIVSLVILTAGFLLVPLPWNIRSYRAIQRFNTVEPRAVNYHAARIPWTPQAIDFIQSLPAFAREGNFLLLTDLAGARGMPTVSRQFVEGWFKDEAGHVPRAISPYSFVCNQGALSFALANNALSEGGFSTRLLDRQRATSLAFGNPKHLQLFLDGYSIGAKYLMEHPRHALWLFGRKLSIFGSGLTQGLTPLDVPLGVQGMRRPADQLGPTPGPARIWPAVILILAGVGLMACLRRRAGGLCVLVIAVKLLVAVAFYGYVREAVSILPFFLVLVALGLDIIPLTPLLQTWPRLSRAQPALIVGCVLVTITVGLFSATRNIRYEISGNIDQTPLWGPGAFESQQPLEIQLIK